MLDEAEVETTPDAPPDDVHERALRRFDASAVPQMELRAQSLEARRFVAIPGAQWDGAWGENFENRIRVEIPKVGRKLRKIETDYRENRIAADYRPSGDKADDDTASTLDGLHRADDARFKSQQARDNAFREAISGGFGAWRLLNVLEDEYDRDNDHQRINPAALIADADQCVFFDANAKLYDKSDARFAFIVTAWTPDAFGEEWGEERATDWPDPTLGANWSYDWFKDDVIRVAEYYEKVDRREAVHVFTNLMTLEEERFWSTEIDAEGIAAMKAQGWRHRKIMRRRCVVEKYVLTGAEVLEGPVRIAGKHIPIVPVYGQREFVDGLERFKGETQDSMDPQRLYNASVSRVAQTQATSMQDTPILAPQQFEGLEQHWADRAKVNPPYLPLNPLLDPETGQIVATGPVGMLGPAQVQPTDAALLQIANSDLTEDDRDGANEVRANVSAEAMDIAATRVDAKSGIYLDNMRQSVAREAEIYLDMAREVYAEQGREVETMDESGGQGTATLAQAYTAPDGEPRIRNDFSRGAYKVVASVSEATATRRDKTVKSSLNVAQLAQTIGDNELATAAILTAIDQMDGEGIDRLQAFARRKGLAIGLHEPTEQEAKEMEAAAQAPDPNSELAQAQAMALQGQAKKDNALAGKAEADTALSVARAAEIAAKIGQPQIMEATPS